MEQAINLKAIASIRKSKKISQEEVGKAIGKDESTYGRIESGKVPLKAHDIPKIAEVLGVSVLELAVVIFFKDKSA
jgi:transcriptional regulator with XRE-family HTH domain